MQKRCNRCKVWKDVSEFWKNKSRNDGYECYCKECYKQWCLDHPDHWKHNKKYWKKYCLAHPEQIKKLLRRGWLKYKYNLSLEEYNDKFINQKGCCEICGRHQSEFKIALAVDHNHKTDKNRGLLCNKCNVRLSLIEDNHNKELSFSKDTDFMKKANMYLKKYNKKMTRIKRTA